MNACCWICNEDSLVDHYGVHYCYQCFVLEFGVGPFEIRFHPEWMSSFRTTTPVNIRDYSVTKGSGSSPLRREDCICDPNNTDPSRDCPLHRPTEMTFGLDIGELRRGGLD